MLVLKLGTGTALRSKLFNALHKKRVRIRVKLFVISPKYYDCNYMNGSKTISQKKMHLHGTTSSRGIQS